MLKDRDIREPLFLFLEEMYGRVRFIEEKRMGASRADVIMVTEDSLVGIEIKSDADSYQRLAGQVKDYDQFCDRNIVAVGSSHAYHIEEHVPDYWGIITVDQVEDKADFYVLRSSKMNPMCKPEQKIKLLWRRELAHIQEINNMPAYRQKSKAFVREKILERVPEEMLKRLLCEELLERDYTTIEKDIKAWRTKRKVRSKMRRRIR